MDRIEKNADGEDVCVNTPAFGCIVIEAAAPEPAPKSKAKPVADAAEAAPEGE